MITCPKCFKELELQKRLDSPRENEFHVEQCECFDVENNEEMIAKQAAKCFSGRDWHRLTENERELISMLKQSGHLGNGRGGFV